ncbi:hypothetical protein M8C21_000074, partial [Ambrosia artemisiifolia]
MTQDIEMKEQQSPSNSTSSTVPVLQHLKEIASLIETGAYAREVRRISRAVRLTIALRKKLKGSVISSFLGFALAPGSEANQRLSSYLSKDDQNDMEVDTALSGATVKHSPELEIYCYLLVLIFLIDQKKYNEAKACSSASIVRLKNLNRRTVDVLASRLYFFYSLSYELTGELSEIRGNLLALHRVATLRHDELGQAVRIGDLELFKTVAERFSTTFSSDRTNNLIVRLRHNVIRTGLRNISISYSRISLADVAKKLRLDSPNPVADAESIVSKAIRDGAIDATLDHANGWM